MLIMIDYDERLGSDYDSPKYISFIITNSLHSSMDFNSFIIKVYIPQANNTKDIIIIGQCYMLE